MHPRKALLWLIVLLAVPAFFMYLGLQPFIPDEAIRALVAQEMIHSGDYLTPTLGGDIYLKKPPLYNWIIALAFQLTGKQNEFVMRLPMLVFLFLFTCSIYKLLAGERGHKQALLVALLFMTNGRILFYESLHGLIDIAFSWLVYLFFILSYKLMRRGKYLEMYLISYALMAIAYLMKGLPSLVFVAITLLVLHGLFGRFKLLFSWKHLSGVALMGLILGSYYLVYFSRNPVEPSEVFKVLLGETTRRTVLRFGWLATVKNLFVFPFNMTYHFLPWSFLLVLMFTKGSLQTIKNDIFLKYNALIIIFNILPYWTSPEVHPRYILMLVPPMMTLLVARYTELKDRHAPVVQWVEWMLGGALIIITLASWTPMLVEPTKDFAHIGLISATLFTALAALTIAYFRTPAYRLMLLVAALLVLRIGLNLTVLPARALLSKSFESRELARQVGELTKGHPLHVWWNPDKPLDPYYGRKRTAYAFMFYANEVRGDRMLFSSEKKPDAYYLARKSDFSPREAFVVKRLSPAEEAKDLFLIKFFPEVAK